MSKIQVTLDATKLRNLVSKREYQNKEGQQVQVQEVKFELVPLKEPKTVFTGKGFKLDKTHFACAIQTKEERDAKAETVYIGEGFTTVWENSQPVYNAVPVNDNTEEENDLPF